MRKWNHILARIILFLFLLHAVMGSLMFLGVSTVSLTPLSWILFTAVVMHGILGIFSTAAAVKSGRETGRWYWKENAAFWVKRISGLAILLLLVFHITAFTTSVNGHFFLKEFTVFRMIAQLLLLLAIFIHLAVSIKSMLIAGGTINFKEKTVDWLLVLSVLILFFTVAVIVYFIHWQV